MLKQLDPLPQVLKQVVKKLVSAKSTRLSLGHDKAFLRCQILLNLLSCQILACRNFLDKR